MLKKILRSPWCWCAIACMALFALSGFVIRGNALNTSIPGGILGWIFWGAIALLAWHFLIAPLAGFAGLPQWDDAKLEAMNDLERLNFLERYAKCLLKRVTGTRRENVALDEHLAAVESSLREMNAERRLRELRESVDALRKFLGDDYCGKIIGEHMKYAAIAVVVSQRGFLDSLVVFAVQVKLIIALSRALGHRPSWAFVSCCMVWVVSNSLISMIFDETDIAETSFASLGEILGAKGGGIFSEIPILKTAANLVMQAATAGASVYITGTLVRSRLLGDSSKRTMKDLLQLRLQGYKESAKLAGSLLHGSLFGNKNAPVPADAGTPSEQQ